MSKKQPKERTYTRAEIIEMLTVSECRVSGMHDPTHTTKYFCDIQRGEALKGLMSALDIKMEDLPRRLSQWTLKDIHESVGARVNYSLTKTREKHIRLMAWAGGAPMGLFQPAADVVTDEGRERVLVVLTEQYETWQTVTKRLKAEYGEDFQFTTDWFWNVVRALTEEGKVEQHDIKVRLKVKDES